MGFLTRLLIPRPVRRVAHPVRTGKRAVRRAVVPKPIRQATYGASQLRNPVRAAAYHGIERPLNTALQSGVRKRSGTPAPVYRHGNCPVKHRSIEAAQRCTNDKRRPTATSPAADGPKAPPVLTDPEDSGRLKRWQKFAAWDGFDGDAPAAAGRAPSSGDGSLIECDACGQLLHSTRLDEHRSRVHR